MPYRQTFVIEYPNAEAAPRVTGDAEILGGKLYAVQFANALEEIEVLRECCRPEDLQRADAILADRWSAAS